MNSYTGRLRRNWNKREQREYLDKDYVPTITHSHSFNRHNKPKRTLSYDELRKRYEKLALLEKESKIRDRIIEENNGWNTELEYIAASIGEKCIGLKWMHAACSSFYGFCYNVMGIAVILITAGAATGTVTQISTCAIDPITGGPATSWVLILVGILMYLSTVILAIQQFKNWGSLAKEHQQIHSNYSELEHEIRINLGIYRKERITGKDYVEIISKEFDNLESSSPNIIPYIQKKYMKLLAEQGNSITHNDIIQRIKIKNEATPSQQTHRPQTEQKQEPPCLNVMEAQKVSSIDSGDSSDSDNSYNGNNGNNGDNGDDVRVDMGSFSDDVQLEMEEYYFEDSLSDKEGAYDWGENIDVEHLKEQRVKKLEINEKDKKESDMGDVQSAEEIEVGEFESPFQNDDRFKYEVKRFLTK